MTTLRRSDPTSDHAAFRESARRFVSSHVTAHLDGWRHARTVDREVFAAAGSHGFLGTCAPESFGGGEADDYAFLAILVEETVDAGSVGLALLWALHSGVAIPALVDHAKPELQQQLLPGLIGGDTVAVVAGRSGDRGIVGAQVADLVLVPDEAETRLLPTDTITITPAPAGLAAPEAGCGDLVITPAASSVSHPLAVPPELIGRDIDLWIAVVAIAAARQSAELARQYADSRRVFGRPLAEFENTQMRIAEVGAELRCTTAYVDGCVAARSRSELTPTDAAAAREVAVGLAGRVADQSLQFHGGYGYMREYPIAQLFADTRFLSTAARSFSDSRQVLAAEIFSGR